MNLSTEQKSLIERVINCFETGQPDGDYSAISIYRDGPHNIRQITYGRSQTTEYGNLRKLVAMYVEANGKYSNDLKPYADRIGSTPLTDDQPFRNLLRQAGKQDPTMRRIQDRFFDQIYFQPAMAWADSEGLSLALSALAIYDSFIHSGSILWVIRQKFPESTPAHGGDEKTWVRQYLEARNQWLSEHPRPAVRASAYRTRDLLAQVQANNWTLEQVPIIANGSKVFPAPETV